MIGDLLDAHLLPSEERSRRPIRVIGVNPDCKACDISWELGRTCGCGDNPMEGVEPYPARWFCCGDCKRDGEHRSRELRICLHGPVEIVS